MISLVSTILFLLLVENNHSVQYVDIRDNSLYKHTSVNLLNSINNDPINHHIEFTMPE